MRRLSYLVLVLVFIFIAQPAFGDIIPNKVIFDKQAPETIQEILSSAQKHIYICTALPMLNR